MLEKHRLTQKIFEAVKNRLEARRLSFHSGTIVVATILTAPSSTKNESDREAFEARSVRYRVNRRGPRANKSLMEQQRWINRTRSRTRARCEHPFRVVKQLRGIEKKLARGYTISALANQYALRQQVMPRRRKYAL